MLDSNGFNLWAADYDNAVGIADENSEYPFAGYKELMNIIYGTIMAKSPVNVLDIGFGTGTLTAKLYDGHNNITGIDFSSEMINIAAKKMPEAELIEYDFTNGLPEALKNRKFDYIISTYAFHHLTDNAKAEFIFTLLDNLTESGSILIGDIGFQTMEELEDCRKNSGDAWDCDEFYFVYSTMRNLLKNKCDINYQQVSSCAGISEIKTLHK